MSVWIRNVFSVSLAVLAFGTLAEDAKKDPPKPDPKDPPKEAGKKDPKNMTLDELEAEQICPVTLKPSKLIYHVKLGDKEYHFNTRAAAKEFEASPEKFGYKKK